MQRIIKLSGKELCHPKTKYGEIFLHCQIIKSIDSDNDLVPDSGNDYPDSKVHGANMGLN